MTEILGPRFRAPRRRNNSEGRSPQRGNCSSFGALGGRNTTQEWPPDSRKWRAKSILYRNCGDREKAAQQTIFGLFGSTADILHSSAPCHVLTEARNASRLRNLMQPFLSRALATLPIHHHFTPLESRLALHRLVKTTQGRPEEMLWQWVSQVGQLEVVMDHTRSVLRDA